jgi:hypothetical protein
MVSTYPVDLAQVSVALDLLEVDHDARIGSAVTRSSERLDPTVAPLDYVTIDWNALEVMMGSVEDQRKLRLAHELLETRPEHGSFRLHDGTYYMFGTIEDGKFRLTLGRIDEPPS